MSLYLILSKKTEEQQLLETLGLVYNKVICQIHSLTKKQMIYFWQIFFTNKIYENQPNSLEQIKIQARASINSLLFLGQQINNYEKNDQEANKLKYEKLQQLAKNNFTQIKSDIESRIILLMGDEFHFKEYIILLNGYSYLQQSVLDKLLNQFRQYLQENYATLLPSELQNLIEIVLKDNSIFDEKFKKLVKEIYIKFSEQFIQDFNLFELTNLWQYLHHYKFIQQDILKQIQDRVQTLLITSDSLDENLRILQMSVLTINGQCQEQRQMTLGFFNEHLLKSISVKLKMHKWSSKQFLAISKLILQLPQDSISIQQFLQSVIPQIKNIDILNAEDYMYITQTLKLFGRQLHLADISQNAIAQIEDKYIQNNNAIFVKN